MHGITTYSTQKGRWVHSSSSTAPFTFTPKSIHDNPNSMQNNDGKTVSLPYCHTATTSAATTATWNKTTPAMQAVRRWTSSSNLIRAAKSQKQKRTLIVCTWQAGSETSVLTDSSDMHQLDSFLMQSKPLTRAQQLLWWLTSAEMQTWI